MRIYLALAAASLLQLTAVQPVAALPSTQDCRGTVVLVHDMAGSTEQWRDLRAQLQESDRCVEAIAYGDTPATLAWDNVAGLAPLEQSAHEIGTHLADYRGRDVDVIAHGAGALAVQHYLQRAVDTPVRSLVTIGPMWRGTNIGGLNEIETISRELGTYDAVLALEKPVIDPVCGGCRQLIAGSDFLTALEAGGLRTEGVRYTDIVSDTDGLVVPPRSAEVSAAETVIVQDVDAGNTTHHFGLVHDPAVLSIAIGALP